MGSSLSVAAVVLAVRVAVSKIAAAGITAAAAVGHIIVLVRVKVAKVLFALYGPEIHVRSHLHVQGICK